MIPSTPPKATSYNRVRMRKFALLFRSYRSPGTLPPDPVKAQTCLETAIGFGILDELSRTGLSYSQARRLMTGMKRLHYFFS